MKPIYPQAKISFGFGYGTIMENYDRKEIDLTAESLARILTGNDEKLDRQMSHYKLRIVLINKASKFERRTT